MSLPVIGMARLVDHNSAREKKNLVFVVGDLDAVGVGKSEPLLRDGRNDLSVSREHVVVVSEISFGFEVVRTGDVDSKTVVEERKQFFLHDRDELATAGDLVGRSPRKNLLLDKRELAAVQVLEREL